MILKRVVLDHTWEKLRDTDMKQKIAMEGILFAGFKYKACIKFEVDSLAVLEVASAI